MILLLAVLPHVMLHVDRLQGCNILYYSHNPRIKLCLYPVFCYTEVLWACQRCSYTTSTSCIITVPYLPDFYLFAQLCIYSLTNPVICIHMLFGFMWCQKEMVFWPDQKSRLISLNSGWQPTKHEPTWLFRCSRAEHTHIHTPDNLLCCFFFLYLSPTEEAFSAQHESLKEEKESLTKLQKECTAKRYVWTCN